jgi:tRNA pseudouridine38-40 synthase
LRFFKLTLAYDGTNYHGWQIQPDRPTVQGELERALAEIFRQPIRVAGSSRTDAGVHAQGQVVSFSLETEMAVDKLRRAINHFLPEDISVRSVEDAREGFHAIGDTVRKRYRYVLHDGPVCDVFRRKYAWWYGRPLDADRMHQGAQFLTGKHDFRSFESQWPTRDSSVRTVLDVCAYREPQGVEQPAPIDRLTRPFVCVEIEADGFLYNMVRSIVGTLVDVGRGAREPAWVGEVLAAQDRSRAGRTAPPEGLTLLWVEHR